MIEIRLMCDGQGMGWGRVTRCYKAVIVLSHTHTLSLFHVYYYPHSNLTLTFSTITSFPTWHSAWTPTWLICYHSATSKRRNQPLCPCSAFKWSMTTGLQGAFGTVLQHGDDAYSTASFNIQQIWSSLHDTSCQPIHEGMRMVYIIILAVFSPDYDAGQYLELWTSSLDAVVFSYSWCWAIQVISGWGDILREKGWRLTFLVVHWSYTRYGYRWYLISRCRDTRWVSVMRTQSMAFSTWYGHQHRTWESLHVIESRSSRGLSTLANERTETGYNALDVVMDAW